MLPVATRHFKHALESRSQRTRPRVAAWHKRGKSAARGGDDARADDGRAADDLVADPARGPLPRRHRDRVAHHRRADPSRYTYRDAHTRARALARALVAARASNPATASATLAWNGYRHFELYYGVSGMGAIVHTINPRLFPEQLVFIVNHAEDKLVFFDLTFVPLVEKLAPACKARQSAGSR